MNTFTPFYIVSGALPGLEDRENAARCETVQRWLESDGYATAVVRGCYQGAIEPAILVIDDRDDCRAAVLRVARQYAQDSILAVDANRAARLVYCETGERESLGQWQCVTEFEAKKRDAWTSRAGFYYIAE